MKPRLRVNCYTSNSNAVYSLIALNRLLTARLLDCNLLHCIDSNWLSNGMLIVWIHFSMPATKMVNSGLTAFAMKHKVGRKSEGKTTEVVSGSRAALFANANVLSCAPGQNGQPAGQQIFRGPPPVGPQQPCQEPNVSVIFFCVFSFFLKL